MAIRPFNLENVPSIRLGTPFYMEKGIVMSSRVSRELWTPFFVQGARYDAGVTASFSARNNLFLL